MPRLQFSKCCNGILPLEATESTKNFHRRSIRLQDVAVAAGAFVVTILSILYFRVISVRVGDVARKELKHVLPESALNMILPLEGSLKYQLDYSLNRAGGANPARPVVPDIPHQVDTTKACSLSLATATGTVSVSELTELDSNGTAPGANSVCIRAQSCRCRQFYNRTVSCGDLRTVLEGEKLYTSREDISSMAYWEGLGWMSRAPWHLENRSETNYMPEVEKIGQYIRWEHRHGVGVICEKSKLLYLKNHKGGSNSVRRVLEHFFPDCHLTETYLGAMKAEQMKDYVIFTSVRDPMERFFSQRMQLTRGGLPGVADYSSISLEDYIDAIYRGVGISDAHQRSFAWYMTSAFGFERVPIRIDYVVRVEHIEDDLNYLLRDALQLIPSDRTVAEVSTHSYPGSYKPTEAVNFDELKDPKARRQLCEILAMDYECAGYRLPEGCSA